MPAGRVVVQTVARGNVRFHARHPGFRSGGGPSRSRSAKQPDDLSVIDYADPWCGTVTGTAYDAEGSLLVGASDQS